LVDDEDVGVLQVLGGGGVQRPVDDSAPHLKDLAEVGQELRVVVLADEVRL
jgi:hypothetical protein